MKRKFVKLLGNEKLLSIGIPVFAILLSLLVGAIVIAIMGKNPLTAYGNLLQGSGVLPKLRYAGKQSMLTDFFGLIDLWTPMIFAALAVAVALKAGLFNIGIAGQMLAAGFVSTVIIGYNETLKAPIAKPLALLIAIMVGGLVGALIGWLKYQFNINEVVSSIMLNYIIQYVVAFFISDKFRDPVSRQSFKINEAASLTLKNVEIGGYKYNIPLGFILAVIVAFIILFVFKKTTFGYELKAVGSNRKAAQYAGINVGKNMVLAMVISGALAGLAGATYYMGYVQSMGVNELPSMGYDSVAVALLGNSNPIGILFASLLISVISKGSNYMQSYSGLVPEIASMITSLILLFSACGTFIRYLLKKAVEKMEVKDHVK